MTRSLTAMIHRQPPLAFSYPPTTTTTAKSIFTTRTYPSHSSCSPVGSLFPHYTRRHVHLAGRRRCTVPLVISSSSSLESSSPPSETLRVLRDEVIETHSRVSADGCSGSGQIVSVKLKTEDLGGRRRRISGCITIPSSAARVWRVLTAYEQMDQFLPNVVASAVQRPGIGKKGDIMLDQIGMISRKLRLKTRLLMRVREDVDKLRLKLERVEGRDFEFMEATYNITEKEEEDKEAIRNRNGNGNVILDYNVVAVPFPLYPMSLVENKMAREVPKMLAAIRDEAVLSKYVPL